MKKGMIIFVLFIVVVLAVVVAIANNGGAVQTLTAMDSANHNISVSSESSKNTISTLELVLKIVAVVVLGGIFSVVLKKANKRFGGDNEN